MRVDRLTSFEGETLIRFLLNHMGLETRRKLMVEFPVIYRKLLGRDTDVGFLAAVKAAVLDDYKVFAPSETTKALARFVSEDGVLRLGKPSEGVNPALERALEQIEEDE